MELCESGAGSDFAKCGDPASEKALCTVGKHTEPAEEKREPSTRVTFNVKQNAVRITYVAEDSRQFQKEDQLIKREKILNHLLKIVLIWKLQKISIRRFGSFEQNLTEELFAT